MSLLEIRVPFDPDAILSLRAGQDVLLSGTVYTARDAAHARMAEALKQGGPLPFDLTGQVIYYVGPTPAPPGKPIGSAGPTTSGRMDPFLPDLLRKGLRATIGKGVRSEAARKAMAEAGAVYFLALAGAGALLSRHIVSSELVAYEDLGPEAIRRLEVQEMPLIVGCDAHGGYVYERLT